MSFRPYGAARLIAVAALVCAAAFVIWRDQQEPAPSTTSNSGTASPSSEAEGTGFDFYVLALSWSPSYCEAEGADANRQQCASGRPYAFIVHGLWPQYEHGYPSDCPTRYPDVPDEMLRGLYDIMPSAGLIRHEWRRHGTCTGLSQKDYFTVLRAARERVEIPAQFRSLDDYVSVKPADVEKAFIASNASIKPDGIATNCDKHYLREVRICMTKDLKLRSCPEVDRNSCRLTKAVMPPMRGG